MPLGNIVAYRQTIWRSPGSQPSPRLHRQLLTRRYSIPLTSIGSTPSSLRGSAGVSEPNLHIEAVRHSDVPHSTGQKPRHISKGTDIHHGNTRAIGRSKDQNPDARQERDTFEENQQFHSYVAILTAGETGPPAKTCEMQSSCVTDDTR